jgi:hypothetical protein
MRLPAVLVLACAVSGCRTVAEDPSDPPTPVRGPGPAASAPAAVATARTIEIFERVTAGMSMAEVMRLCGAPDEEVGSGIFIYLYRLSDGSFVRVGTPDKERLLYVVHVHRDGTTRDIVRRNDSGPR